MKICKKCHINKELNEYHKDISKKDGLHNNCKICRSNSMSEYYINNKDSIFERRKDYRSTKEYKEKAVLRAMKWRKNNPIKKEHKEKLPKIKKDNTAYMKNYMQKRRKTDYLFRIKDCLRNRLNKALKVKKWQKNTTFNKYIGCSQKELINHIQLKFTEGMSWVNYGKWEIDHIKPLSLAKNEQEMYDLCNYQNLQPLWKIDNIKKGNKV